VLGAFNSYQPTFGNGSGSNGGLSGGGTSTSPVPTLPSIVPVTDIGLFGLRSRRNLARLSGDLSVGLSSRDSLTFSAYAEAARYKANTPLGNYDAFSGSVGYSRQVTDRLRVGVRASASTFNYKVDNSKSRVFPIEVTVSGRLSEQWTIDGAAGATFINNNSVGSTSKTSLSGNLSLCRRGQRTTLCILGARQASPTGFIGTQYVTSAGLNWSTRLNERSNLSFSADYSKVGVGSVPLAAARAFQSEFAQAVVSYDRRISQRLRLVASANYRQLLSDSTGRPKDFGGQIGISYRLGDPR